MEASYVAAYRLKQRGIMRIGQPGLAHVAVGGHKLLRGAGGPCDMWPHTRASPPASHSVPPPPALSPLPHPAPTPACLTPTCSCTAP